MIGEQRFGNGVECRVRGVFFKCSRVCIFSDRWSVVLDGVRVSVFLWELFFLFFGFLIITRKTFSLTLHYALDEAYTSG